MLRYRGASGIPRASIALDLMDGGTHCPEETGLRLMFHDAGLPPPRTSIRLRDGIDEAVIGMGWEVVKVGVSRVTPNDGSLIQLTQRHELVQRLGWTEIQVAGTAPPRTVVHRVRDELWRRRRRRARAGPGPPGTTCSGGPRGRCRAPTPRSAAPRCPNPSAAHWFPCCARRRRRRPAPAPACCSRRPTAPARR